MEDSQAIEGISGKSNWRNFNLLVTSSSIARLGSSGFAVAVVWIALTLTKSPVIAGLSDGMVAAPLFLSFAFGAYVDRLQSKKTLAVATAIGKGLAILIMLVSLAVSSILLRTAAIFATSFLIGLTTDIFNSISASWTKQFLMDNDYKKGTSLIQSVTSMMQAVGYAISGLLLTVSYTFAILGFSAVFITSSVPLILVRNEDSHNEAKSTNLQNAMREGLRYIFGDSRLRAIIILTLAANLAFGTTSIFFAALIADQFRLPGLYYTLFFASLTMGIIVGSASGSKLKGKVGFYSFLTLLAMGIMTFSIGLITDLYVDYGVTFVIGLLIGLINVVVMTALVKAVKQEMMGRVMGAINTFAVSLSFSSGAIGGVLISGFHIQHSFFLIGIILAAVSFVPFMFREYYHLKI